MKINWKKVLTIGVPIATAGLSFLSSVMEDKKMEDKISEKVSEAVANAVNKES